MTLPKEVTLVWINLETGEIFESHVLTAAFKALLPIDWKRVDILGEL